MRWLAEKNEPSPPTTSEPALDAEQAGQAVWFDVESVVDLLRKHSVDYVLVGGYALYANGLTRATGYVDILVRNIPEKIRRRSSPDGSI
ncbi:MAG: hypothetical protein HQL42_15440 [Alphaproteobacteria bacterium]|nr:hypothetical protein [Alphaproteobacteria bacterium]